MRYLNKIVLIASANIKYSEVNLDGNVHFIGTQGVGKSTLLRALLFFYNANQQKLGIPLGKKSFVDFYFPFQNSFIIYEVVKETGPFCILVFKSQGRICFRFLDTGYDKSFLVDTDGKIFENWDKIKSVLGKDVHYTRKIDKYEEYRNILYGNSLGLNAEFRKYAILESKQYQNIPRAIQHVFLNYKVESEFIKDTIIKSLNEDEIKIDLSNYAHHLKDFDSQLNDIRKWTDKTRGGESIVRKQAETVIGTYAAIKFLWREKDKLAGALNWQLNEIKKQQPKITEKLEREKGKELQLVSKFNDLDKKYRSKQEKITAEVSVFESKLKEAKQKSEEYAGMNIEGIIQRVEKKVFWETERDTLTQQKDLLETRYADVSHKYQALIAQQENQFFTFQNLNQTEINNKNQDLLIFKEAIAKEYDDLFEAIKKQHQEELHLAKNLFEDKKTEISKLLIQKSETKHKRFFETDIEQCKVDISNLNEKIRDADSMISQQRNDAEALKKQWEIEKERIEGNSVVKKERFNQQGTKLKEQITAIDHKIENSKDSLYGWLNQEYDGWEKTIGKVIDDDHLLFKQGLSPSIVSKSDLSLYGVNLDLNEINKTVKTVADYQRDKVDFNLQIDALNKNIQLVSEQLNTDLENLRRKQQPKIIKCKETIQNAEYSKEQATIKLNEIKFRLEEYHNKAEADKKQVLERIELGIQELNEQKLNADEAISKIENGIKKKIENKRSEKDQKTTNKQTEVSAAIAQLKSEINAKQVETAVTIDELKAEKSKELNSKGADTNRIAEIDQKLITVKVELDFIETNRDKVSDYKKDKREFFDRVDHFKNQKVHLEYQLANEQTKLNVQKLKFDSEIGAIKNIMAIILQEIQLIDEDLMAYDTFSKTDCFASIEDLITEPADQHRNDKRCKILIDDLNAVYYKGIDRYRVLQESINKFNGNFSSQNIFSFKTILVEQSEYFQYADDLKEFIEEDKISLYEKRVNELFADIIKQVGKETTDLLSKEGEIQSVIFEINKDFVKRNFAGVIKSIELRVVSSANKIVHLLTEIKKFNDDNIHDLGAANLFSSNEQVRDDKNKKAIGLLTLLVKEIAGYRNRDINLSDSFELEFKIVENDNDTNWVQNLANVGSDGTDVLVKAMINIMLLNVFKEGATKNRFKDFRLHCMMDEIGKLHPNNVRGILKFANDRNIFLINSSPQSFDALAYRYTYKLAKDDKSVTVINRLITDKREN